MGSGVVQLRRPLSRMAVPTQPSRATLSNSSLPLTAAVDCAVHEHQPGVAALDSRLPRGRDVAAHVDDVRLPSPRMTPATMDGWGCTGR